MLEFFAKDWKGSAFELFGAPHLVGIAIIVAINLFLIFGWKNPSPRARKIFRYTLATLLVVNETMWHWWNWSIGAWTWQSMLPLHICSLMVWLIAWMLYYKQLIEKVCLAHPADLFRSNTHQRCYVKRDSSCINVVAFFFQGS